MTRFLLTGASGMLGRDLQSVLDGRDVTALSRSDLDVTDLDAVRSAVAGHDVVINAAAHTRVDDAETERDAAFAVNATGAGHLATAAAEVGAVLVQVSTDYVFDGVATSPYPEDAPHAPVSVYGASKAEGERLVVEANGARSYIVRTAWLYGEHGPNFAKTMLRLAADRDTLTVVSDQVGQPTWTLDLAKQIVTLVDSAAPFGAYHATNSGQTSWFDYARVVFANAGLDPERVTPTDSGSFVRPAPRPAYSVLGHDAWTYAGLAPMRDWTDALADAMSRGIMDPS
ncbi:dTDP-4-dehydrorhamnose reductase [Marisediminicola sp. LYQ134]|uniref:dTDP-4-dehydrorhamnose reductase n=1 Tax=unclassified Marisediminicola TaxID=2618316 RepID=UPI003982FB5A